MTRIQIIGDNPAYLETTQDIPVPITISIGDIRDVSKRNGSFSKTIVLPGTHNNNQVLGYLFDINVINGTFDINKIQECAILQEGIVVLDNLILQLVGVKKRQNIVNEDDIIEYSVLIKDNVGDFYTKISSKFLNDLDFSDFDHLYDDTSIEGSFNNTWVDGYKYILPWIEDSSTQYDLQELKPSIYAKQYFDRIHENAGYSYDWSSISDQDVRFDKLIIPYNGDDKKLSEEAKEIARVIANRTTQPTTDYEINQIDNGSTIPFVAPLTIPNEVQDGLNLYNPSTSIYTNAFNLNPPNGLDFTFTITYQFILDNMSSAATNGLVGGRYLPAIWLYDAVTDLPLSAAINFTSTYTTFPVGFTLAPGENIIQSQTITRTFTQTNINSLQDLQFKIGVRQNGSSFWQHPSGYSNEVRPIVRISALEVNIALNSETIEYNSPIFLNNYIPKKIKQTDFIKSICLMYNLFADEDPTDPNKIIYKHRDNYYDSGALKDWTKKLQRSEFQEVSFLPELTAKRVILSYKEDKDSANVNYLDATKEIYGRQEVLFSSEFIKGIDTKELVFSPTPVMTTSFGAVTPLFAGKSPNCNIRILLDNGLQPCGSYSIKYEAGTVNTRTSYPFVSHLDAEYNPTFDINFGVCDFYFYDIETFTSNNLYNINWRRTMAQLDQGKMLTAFFYLNPVDIQTLKLNDKIRIDNSYWNINKIIDYNANSKGLTKVELLSIDDDLILPRFGKVSTFRPVWAVDKVQDSIRLVKPDSSIQGALDSITMKRYRDSSVYNTTTPVINIGKNNVINTNGGGLVIGNDLQVDSPGVYVGDVKITEDGGFSSLYYSEDSSVPKATIEVIDLINTVTDTISVDPVNNTTIKSENTTTGELSYLNINFGNPSLESTDGTNTSSIALTPSVISMQGSEGIGLVSTDSALNITDNITIDPQGLGIGTGIKSENLTTAEYSESTYTPTNITLKVEDGSAPSSSEISMNASSSSIVSSDGTINSYLLTTIPSIQMVSDDGLVNSNIDVSGPAISLYSIDPLGETSQITIESTAGNGINMFTGDVTNNSNFNFTSLYSNVIVTNGTDTSSIYVNPDSLTLESLGINTSDSIFLDPNLLANGSGIQSFDNITGSSQGQFYVRPFDSEWSNFDSANNIQDSIFIDPQALTNGTCIKSENTTTGELSQTAYTPDYVSSVVTDNLTTYQGNIDITYDSLSNSISSALQTTNLGGSSFGQIVIATDLALDTTGISIISDSLALNVPPYADDADAAAAGLTTGKVYQTDGTGASPLNVAGILMIKQ